MKTAICIVFSVAVGILLPWVWAEGVWSESAGDPGAKAAYAALLDDLIRKYEAKMALGASSHSEALQEDGRRAGLKAAFCTRNRDALMEAMAVDDLPVKDYQVHRYVNGCFIEAMDRIGLEGKSLAED